MKPNDKKLVYRNNSTFVNTIEKIVKGYYFTENKPISINELAEIMNCTTAAIRRRKRDSYIIQLLKDRNIEFIKIKNTNHLQVIE